jgi:hypothetical protein
MALDNGIDLFNRREKAGEIDLPMILERDLSKNRLEFVRAWKRRSGRNSR